MVQNLQWSYSSKHVLDIQHMINYLVPRLYNENKEDHTCLHVYQSTWVTNLIQLIHSQGGTFATCTSTSHMWGGSMLVQPYPIFQVILHFYFSKIACGRHNFFSEESCALYTPLSHTAVPEHLLRVKEAHFPPSTIAQRVNINKDWNCKFPLDTRISKPKILVVTPKFPNLKTPQ